MLQLSQFHRCWVNAPTVAAASIAAATVLPILLMLLLSLLNVRMETCAQLCSRNATATCRQCLMHSHKNPQRKMVDL